MAEHLGQGGEEMMSNNPVDVSLYVSDESNCAGFKTVLPKPSTNWHCQLFGGGPTGMILIPPEGKESGCVR